MDFDFSMDPISAGAGLLGGILGGNSAKKAAKAQMAFQERMDNTKYQRSRADLEAAGYNPIMAVYNGVSGAPSGAMDMSGQIMSQAVSNSVNSGISAKRTNAEVKNMDLMNNKIIADTAASNSSAALNRALAIQSGATTAQTTAATKKMGADPKYILGDILQSTGISGSIGPSAKAILDNVKSGIDYLNPAKAFRDFYNHLTTNSAKSSTKPLAIPSLKQLNSR